MGCCLGTARTPKPVPPHPKDGPNLRHHHHHYHAKKPNSLTQTHIEKPETRSPPPPLVVEEETVKEVLSETPIFKPQNPEISPEKNTLSPPKEEPNLAEEEPKLQAEPPPKEAAVSEASQLSEPCGISESYSYSTTTTTTTIADAREDEATSNRKRELGPRANGSSGPVRRKRPYSGEVASQRERGPKPPRRTPEPAAGKRNRTETTSFRGRESGQLRTMQRSGAVPTGVRRETVSSRSRSPATRNAGGVNRAGRGKSPAKVTGRAGGSSSSVGVEESEKKGNNNEPKEEVLAGKKEPEEEQPNDGVSQPQQGKESLDNPLVSLECFIFV
ncbi:hypothetical protein ABKV19_010244 [Rosa sericea]